MSFLNKLAEKTKEVTIAAEQALEDSLGKYVKAPREVRDNRLSICNSCDYYNKSMHQCRVCGCFMDVKTWLPQAGCPKGFWEPIRIIEDQQN